MTREQAGRILGVVLLLALMLGIPYGIMSFVMWNLDPSQWDTTARGLTVFGATILAGAYIVNQLPAAPPEAIQ